MNYKAKIEKTFQRDEYESDVWRLGPHFLAMVNHFKRPNVFINYKSLDIFNILTEIGFKENIEEGKIEVTFPHGIGHNCFKMESEKVLPFLQLLQEFVEQNESIIETALSNSSKVKDWKTSWWEKEVGVKP